MINDHDYLNYHLLFVVNVIGRYYLLTDCMMIIQSINSVSNNGLSEIQYQSVRSLVNYHKPSVK